MERADSDGARTPLIDGEPVKELDGAKAFAEAAKKTDDSAEIFMLLSAVRKCCGLHRFPPPNKQQGGDACP